MNNYFLFYLASQTYNASLPLNFDIPTERASLTYFVSPCNILLVKKQPFLEYFL